MEDKPACNCDRYERCDICDKFWRDKEQRAVEASMPYQRGYIAGLKAAAKVISDLDDEYTMLRDQDMWSITGVLVKAEDRIRALIDRK